MIKRVRYPRHHRRAAVSHCFCSIQMIMILIYFLQILQKKNFDIRVYPNKKRFSGNLQKFGLGHGATEPHPDRTQIGVSPFKKAPFTTLCNYISHYETHSRIDNDSHSHLGSAPKRRRK